MSKESPPVREVIPFKPGKRQSTFRKLKLDFAGTALEEALARQQQQAEINEQVKADEPSPAAPTSGANAEPSATPLTPVTGVNSKRKMTPVTGVISDAAPQRDFTRAANSIVRDAIPAGVFTGKGKHLYDYLYSQTRGAITPVRSARIPTEKVMSGAGMTRNTFRFHMERLCNAGLIQVEQRAGEHGGNVYTVFLPEEVGLQRPDGGDSGDPCDPCDRGEKLPLVQGSEVDPSNPCLSPLTSMAYSQPKTLYKTIEKTDDDEAFARALREAERELTGRSSGAENWEPLFELLATELRIAAARTTVSSVPAFLTEHLRRRLFKLDKSKDEVEATNAQAEAPTRRLTAEQIKSCEDCAGTGWWYPEGYEGGAAKCKHEKLTNP